MDPRRFWLAALAVCSLGWSSARAQEPIGYNRTIRPILAENCFACHGPDSASRKADLRLDKREAAIEAGAIVPGKPGESELIERIISDDPENDDAAAGLAQEAVQPAARAAGPLDRRGAEYQPHWSFIAPVRPQLPAVQDSAWLRNPIDDFVLARLEAAGLAARRRSRPPHAGPPGELDLTGLPPEPAEVEAFVNDTSPATPTSS